MVKMFHARRNPDAAQKQQITESSSVIAEIMVQHLNLKNFSESIDFFHELILIFSSRR
jgi:E3 ubiquitin-protein ligase HUWE1